MPETLDLSSFVRHGANGTAHMELAVEGVGCASCIRKIESGLRQLPGVVDARLNFTNRRLAVDWHDQKMTAGEVIEALAHLGYRAQPFALERAEADEARYARKLLICLAVAGFAAMNIMLLSVSVWSGNVTDMTQETRDFFHWLSALIALPAAAYAGQPFFKNAWRALRIRQLNMDVPISLAVLLALSMSLVETINHAEHAYFDSAVMLLFFLLCGRYLDHAMRRKTRAFAGNLAALKGEIAHRLDASGELVAVPVGALKPDDRILVRPGERVPADGIVMGGTSEIDSSLVTGETAREPIAAGATIYAGSMNYSGTLTVRVTSAGASTLIAEVERLLEKAVAVKSRYLRLADRAARLYAPLVHTAAALTAVGWLIAGASIHDAIVTAISVLIITCPCALALAIPAVQVVSSGAMFRANLILNSGDAIERLAEANTIVFDKTGTLTLPEPRVDNAAELEPDMLELAARLALTSHHPLAAAVAREARERLPIEGAIEEPGQGVRAIVNGQEARLGSPDFCATSAALRPNVSEPGTSIIAFAYAGRSILLAVRQKLRSDAAAVVRALAARGFEIHILSGDRPAAVEPIATALGITAWRAGLKPADKIAAIEALKAAGRRVLMVGDGLNDAPALASANVSLSPISAVDITQTHADAVFLGERLAPVLDAVTIARGGYQLMLQNLWLAAIYNAIAVPIAIAGLVTPLVAAIAMSGSSLIVTLNALRARGKSRTKPVVALEPKVVPI
ncbi:MAG TPA: heavy metal translocating P-type ATPase [Xanthobacteraceae bacterium]|nr:heavy metal translocating P-type ATPase [Xanthobacteraceae bacterium]